MRAIKSLFDSLHEHVMTMALIAAAMLAAPAGHADPDPHKPDLGGNYCPGWRDGRRAVPRALLRRRALSGRLVLARHTARHVRDELLRGGAMRRARSLLRSFAATGRAVTGTAWRLRWGCPMTF